MIHETKRLLNTKPKFRSAILPSQIKEVARDLVFKRSALMRKPDETTVYAWVLSGYCPKSAFFANLSSQIRAWIAGRTKFELPLSVRQYEIAVREFMGWYRDHEDQHEPRSRPRYDIERIRRETRAAQAKLEALADPDALEW